MKTTIVASLVLAVTSGAAFAGTPLINARQNAQALHEPERRGSLD